MSTWRVYSPSKQIDVFNNGKPYKTDEDLVFDGSTDPEDVRNSLINHDGYPEDIEVWEVK